MVDREEEVVLNARRARAVYLITYSQADLEKFPTRESFATAVVNLFNGGRARVINWVCCRESHRDGGMHYHIAVKLSEPKRWLAIRNELQLEYGIAVNFSSVHELYYQAWRYVTKDDNVYIESEGHPDLQSCEPPRTTRATRARQARVNQSEAPAEGNRRGKRKQRLTNIMVADILVKKNIKSRTELLAVAHTQAKEGSTSLKEFVLNHGVKRVEELITTTWEMHDAKDELTRSQKSRLEILESFLDKECVPGCNMAWRNAASELLNTNEIPKDEFCGAVKVLLEKGRGKYRNLMIVGPANCGKTFLLLPLCKIYRCFINPASTTFAWVGAEIAEIILLNDFRWSSQIIPWHDLLQMLEGQPVHLSAPKTHFSKDLVLDKDTPIFCTSSRTIQYISQGGVEERETEMMNVRWKVFAFWHQIPPHRQQELTPCPTCFAYLIMNR